jgi:hypothetical protein
MRVVGKATLLFGEQMKSSVKLILALAMMIACFAIESAHSQITQTKQDSNTITVSGGSFRLDNKIGTVTNAFEDVIQGAPSTVSVVIKGCMRGADALGLAATCDTLDTYNTVANSIRKPTISVAYDYFLITASWTGGSSPSVGVYRMGTIARNGTSGPGGGVTSVFSLTGVVPDLTGDVTTGGSTATTLKNTGSAGTYQQVTTDAQGRVTAGVTRTVATSAPLGGGGALTSDLTLTCATCALTSGTLAQFAATSSSLFFGNISDETGGSGLVVGNQSPTIVTPTIANFVNANHDHSNSAGGGQISTTAVASGNKTGTGTKFTTGTGTYTSGNCVKIDANGNLVDNGSACAGGGGFTAPDNWARANGHWTGGGNSALIPSTYTLTSDGLGASNLFAFNLVATAVSAAGGAGDVKVGNITSTVTGPAQAGSTWANTYNTGTFNLTSGNLTHGLQDIQRATMTSTAGTTTDLFASGYFTAGLVNANGATSSANVMNVGWDGALSGTGTITDMATIVAGAPGAITGSPTVTSFEGIVAPDVGNSTVPGTSKAGISIGGQVSGGIKTALFIPASSGTYTNSFYISGLGYFGTGFTTGAAGGTINGNFTAANTTVQLSTNTTPNGMGFYNGNAAHFLGQLTSAGDFGVQNAGRSRTDLKIAEATGLTQVRRIAVNQGTAIATGDIAISAGWGSTASKGTFTGYDQAGSFTITSSGTGQAANPTITLTFHDGTWTTAAPVCQMWQNAGTGTIADLENTTESLTAPVFTYVGTPVASSTYRISWHCWGV